MARNIITEQQIEEWLRIDPDTDRQTVEMLIDSAIDTVEHETGRDYRTYPVIVPAAIVHAVAVLVAAHYEDREGASDSVMVTVRRLCAAHKVWSL